MLGNNGSMGHQALTQKQVLHGDRYQVAVVGRIHENQIKIPVAGMQTVQIVFYVPLNNRGHIFNFAML